MKQGWTAVEVIAVNDQDEIIEEIDVFAGWMDRYKLSSAKNGNVGCWTKILIASEYYADGESRHVKTIAF